MPRISVWLKGESKPNIYEDAVIEEGDWCIYITQYAREYRHRVKRIFPKAEILSITIRRDSDEVKEE